MQSTAQAWLVLLLTNSPLAIGLVALFQFFPVMVLALVGGAIADRLPRYRPGAGHPDPVHDPGHVFGVLVGRGLIQLWQVYLLAFLNGLVNAIDTPSRQTFAVDLVDREHRANAVALNSMVFNASRIVGPAQAGLLIGPLGIAAILYVNAASFLAVLRSAGHGHHGLERRRPHDRDARRAAGRRAALRPAHARGAAGDDPRGRHRDLRLQLQRHPADRRRSSCTPTPPATGRSAPPSARAPSPASLVMAYTRRLTIPRLAAAAGAFAILLAAVALTTTSASPSGCSRPSASPGCPSARRPTSSSSCAFRTSSGAG